jgi:hypothetical protein
MMAWQRSIVYMIMRFKYSEQMIRYVIYITKKSLECMIRTMQPLLPLVPSGSRGCVSMDNIFTMTDVSNSDESY